MGDYLIRATAAKGEIRAFACTTKELTEYARSAHNTAPVCTAALGRLMAAALMMGADMKGERDLLTLKIEGDGPMRSATVTADSHGHVKGYVGNPIVLIPANEKGKLDVAGAIGAGTLRVIKDIGLKEPYVGQIELISGEIAEDVTYYFAASEQIPSSVGLGVLMNKENTVRQAGGFVIQLMPGASDEVIDALEQKLAQIKPVTTMLNDGMSPEDILNMILGDLNLEINEKTEVAYRCDCSKERVERAIISIGRKDIQEMIEDGKEIEVNCQFCEKTYKFSVDELKEMLERAKH